MGDLPVCSSGADSLEDRWLCSITATSQRPDGCMACAKFVREHDQREMPEVEQPSGSIASLGIVMWVVIAGISLGVGGVVTLLVHLVVTFADLVP